MIRTGFGTSTQGETVERIELRNAAISISVLTLGATLQSVRLTGLDRDLTIGSPRLSDYEPDGGLAQFGAVVGPVANRISGAQCRFDGRDLTFEVNAAGAHCLHGGSAGLHLKVWQVVLVEEARVVLATQSADGEGGFPGNRRWEAEFTLGAGAAFDLLLRAETDAPTLMNLANHSYWNLGDSADFHGHRLWIDADTVLPADANAMVTGATLPVEGTAYDFRIARPLAATDRLDTNYCLASARGPLREVAALTGPDGLRMNVATTEPGLQIYDGRHLPADGVPMPDGRRLGRRCGLAMEAQFWPDAPNQPAFPSIRVEPGDAWEQVTRFSFTQS